MAAKPIKTASDMARVLKERRTDLGITQKQLADFCDLSHNGISRIEIAKSDIKLSTMVKMSRILGFKIVIEMDE